MKGQQIGVLTVFLFLFIVAGNLYSALYIQDDFRQRIDVTVGDFNSISEAKTKGQLYIPRMEKELNYSSNIIALNIGPGPGGYRDWNEIPNKSELRGEYYNQTRDELETQSRVAGRCTDPEIENVTTDQITQYTSNFSTPWIECTRTSSEANITLPNETIKVDNVKNRYVSISDTSVELRNHVEQRLPSWGSGFGSDTECDDSFEARENAIEEAKYDAVKDWDPAGTAMQGFNHPDYIAIDYDHEFSYNQVSLDVDGVDECGEDDEDTVWEADAEYEVDNINYMYELWDDERTVLNSNANRETIYLWFELDHDPTA